MQNLIIAPALLRMTADGRIFKLAFTWLLKLWSVSVVLGGLWISIKLWQTGNPSTQGVFGQIIFQVALILAAYLAAHISWLRAQNVEALPQAGGDLIIPLTRLMLRLGGEVFASLTAVLCTGGALAIWISAGNARMSAPELSLVLPVVGGASFPAGLSMLVTGLLSGAFGLLAGYLASELLGIFCAIETNTRKAGKG